MTKRPFPARKPSRESGRPTLYGEAMRPYPVRMTAAQNEKFSRLGGASWLRRTIEETKESQ